MALVELFESAMEELEDNSLAGLMKVLCDAASEHELNDEIEKRKFVQIFSLLVGLADWPTRKEVADSVLSIPDLPSEIYLFFACDMITIAEPFLHPDFDLSDEDCVHIAKNATLEHRLFLTERPDLAPAVVRELLRAGEVAVVRALHENQEEAVFYEYDDSFDPFGVDEEGGEEDAANALPEVSALDLMVTNFAAKSRFADMVEVLSKQAHLPKAIIKDLFNKPDAEPFSILCKGLGIGQDAFAVVGHFRCRRLGQMGRLAEQAIEDYQELDPEYALAMLKELQAQNSWLPNIGVGG